MYIFYTLLYKFYTFIFSNTFFQMKESMNSTERNDLGKAL